MQSLDFKEPTAGQSSWPGERDSLPVCPLAALSAECCNFQLLFFPETLTVAKQGESSLLHSYKQHLKMPHFMKSIIETKLVLLSTSRSTSSIQLNWTLLSLFPSVRHCLRRGQGILSQGRPVATPHRGTRRSCCACLLPSAVTLTDADEELLIPTAVTCSMPQAAMRWPWPAVPWGWRLATPCRGGPLVANPGLWRGSNTPAVT